MPDDHNREPRAYNVLSLAGAVFLGAILIIATIGKVLDPVLFVEQIRKEGLEGLLSANTVALCALALEMGLGVALLLGVRSLWVLIPSAGLVTFFLALTGRAFWLVITGQRDDTYDCGCFGVFLERTAKEAFWQDLLLLLPALFLAFLSRRALFASLSKWKIVVAASSAFAIVFYTAAIVGLPPAIPLPAQQEAGNPDLFVSNQQFLLRVADEVDPEAKIYESPLSLRFLVLSDQLQGPLLLDARAETVSRIASSDIRASAEGVEIDVSVQPDPMGNFSIDGTGISFELDGQMIRLLIR